MIYLSDRLSHQNKNKRIAYCLKIKTSLKNVYQLIQSQTDVDINSSRILYKRHGSEKHALLNIIRQKIKETAKNQGNNSFFYCHVISLLYPWLTLCLRGRRLDRLNDIKKILQQKCPLLRLTYSIELWLSKDSFPGKTSALVGKKTFVS